MTNATKTCNSCKACLPASAFYARRASKDGLSPNCCECTKAKVSAYRDANRERINAVVRSRYQSRARSLEQRFWEKVDTEGEGCWLWQASCVGKGYGTFSMDLKNALAHRVAYELTYGPIPEGLYVLHDCDTPACCNPKHLRLGTHVDNMADMRLRGRASSKSGEDHTAKFSDEQIREIRRRAAAGEKQRDIAADFGTSQQYVSSLARGLYRHSAKAETASP